MSINFTPVTSALKMPLQARIFLQRSLERGPLDDQTLPDILESIDAGTGLAYLIHDSADLVGCVYYEMSAKAPILNVACFGGKGVMEWVGRLQEFTKQLAKLLNCKQVLLMSRRGWERVLPDFKPKGTIYVLEW